MHACTCVCVCLSRIKGEEIRYFASFDGPLYLRVDRPLIGFFAVFLAAPILILDSTEPWRPLSRFAPIRHPGPKKRCVIAEFASAPMRCQSRLARFYFWRRGRPQARFSAAAAAAAGIQRLS
jgi:hypothetical protein